MSTQILLRHSPEYLQSPARAQPLIMCAQRSWSSSVSVKGPNVLFHADDFRRTSSIAASQADFDREINSHVYKSCEAKRRTDVSDRPTKYLTPSHDQFDSHTRGLQKSFRLQAEREVGEMSIPRLWNEVFLCQGLREMAGVQVTIAQNQVLDFLCDAMIFEKDGNEAEERVEDSAKKSCGGALPPKDSDLLRDYPAVNMNILMPPRPNNKRVRTEETDLEELGQKAKRSQGFTRFSAEGWNLLNDPLVLRDEDALSSHILNFKQYDKNPPHLDPFLQEDYLEESRKAAVQSTATAKRDVDVAELESECCRCVHQSFQDVCKEQVLDCLGLREHSFANNVQSFSDAGVQDAKKFSWEMDLSSPAPYTKLVEEKAVHHMPITISCAKVQDRA